MTAPTRQRLLHPSLRTVLTKTNKDASDHVNLDKEWTVNSTVRRISSYSQYCRSSQTFIEQTDPDIAQADMSFKSVRTRCTICLLHWSKNCFKQGIKAAPRLAPREVFALVKKFIAWMDLTICSHPCSQQLQLPSWLASSLPPSQQASRLPHSWVDTHLLAPLSQGDAGLMVALDGIPILEEQRDTQLVKTIPYGWYFMNVCAAD